MKFLKLIGVIGLAVSQCSCLQNGNEGREINDISMKDTCRNLVSYFNYPDDIERLDSLFYVCNSSLLDSASIKRQLQLKTRFDDRNYSLFNYDFRTKLLWDKKNDFILCFKRNVDYPVFNKESIERIYIIDKYLMPLYSVGLLPGTGKTIIEKLYYDAKHEGLYSYVLELVGEVQIEIKTIDYAGIIKLVKMLNEGRYTQTDKWFSYESDHFKIVPYWTEN